jgi:hypothetical protein
MANRYNHIWKVDTSRGSFSLDNILPQYNLLLATRQKEYVLQHLAVDAVDAVNPNAKGLVEKLYNELMEQEQTGIVNVKYVGRDGLATVMPKRIRRLRKSIPGYEGMKHAVIEGLYQERRNSPNYAEMDDSSLRQSVTEFVDNLPEHQVRGMYFDRFNPNAKSK